MRNWILKLKLSSFLWAILALTFVSDFAIAHSANEPPTDGILIENIDNSLLDSPQNSANPEAELSFTYDPKNLQETQTPSKETKPEALEHLKSLSQMMKTQDYKLSLEKDIQTPTSIDDESKLELISTLSSDEIHTFLNKKTLFLETVAKGLRILRFKPVNANKLIQLMNAHFFKNAVVIAKANTKVYSIQIGISGGYGLNKWIMSRIKEFKYFQSLPDNSGFFFILSTGFSIVKTQKEGKTKISIEPIADFWRAKKILSPFIFGTAGVLFNYGWEKRESNSTLQKASFLKLSALNMTSGPEQFGFSAKEGLSLPPGGSIPIGVEGDVYRLRLTTEIARIFFSRIKKIIQATSAPVCAEVL